MASVLRAFSTLVSSSIRNNAGFIVKSTSSQPNLLQSQNLLQESVRWTNFFGRLTAAELWKGCTSVSNAGKKKGRGRGVGKKSAKNLNRGQIIGVGKTNMVWPGLNTPVLKGREKVEQKRLPEDPSYQEKILQIRSSFKNFRLPKVPPLLRGWCGVRLGGRSVGPPDPIGEEKFEGFDTKVLQFKSMMTMTSIFGKKRKVSCFVVTGNKKGLAGFALAKSPNGQSALRRAKAKAGQRLLHFELCDDHTVFHDFCCRFGTTVIFVHKKPRGFGLVCHRGLKTICEMIGIKDLHAKVEGNTKNYQNITKAFFYGLLKQKTFQQLANEKRLHVVEIREENDYFPKVVASPEVCRTQEEIPPDEELDINMYISDGKVQFSKPKPPMFYTRLPGWQTYLKKTLYKRNHEQVKAHYAAKYGEEGVSWMDFKNYQPVTKGVGAYPGKDWVSKYVPKDDEK